MHEKRSRLSPGNPGAPLNHRPIECQSWLWRSLSPTSSFSRQRTLLQVCASQVGLCSGSSFQRHRAVGGVMWFSSQLMLLTSRQRGSRTEPAGKGRNHGPGFQWGWTWTDSLLLWNWREGWRMSQSLRRLFIEAGRRVFLFVPFASFPLSCLAEEFGSSPHSFQPNEEATVPLALWRPPSMIPTANHFVLCMCRALWGLCMCSFTESS